MDRGSNGIQWWSVLALAVAVIALGAGPRPSSDGDEILDHVNEPWTGDLAGIINRGFIRVLTVHNPLFFTFDGEGYRGLEAETAKALGKHLDKQIGRVRSPTVVLIPVARDRLLPGLAEGLGDVAMANITITPERRKLVDFSDPTYPDIREVVVTGPAAAGFSSFEDLVRTSLHLRRSSSYFEHVQQVNTWRREIDLPPIPVREADEHLEDHDLLDMVGAGLIPAVVVDNHKAALWSEVFEGIEVHEDLSIHTGNEVAIAFRKKSPELEKTLNEFVRTIKKGTLLGNMALERYLGNTDWVDNALSIQDRERYEQTADLIRRYASEYEFDWLMIAAQCYQESRFDNKKRSPAGAVGIMQLLPTTAADPAIGIPDIKGLEDNIHAGVKYLGWLRDRYFSDPAIDSLDRLLLTLAAYNAGPGNVAKARKRAKRMGFDPNVWFGHVEVGMYRAVSGEPVSYVRNIYKYYVTYRGLEETRAEREAAIERLE